MTLPLLVRPMLTSELSMVLRDWKLDMAEQRMERKWGRGITDRDFWCLANFVIDKVVLPKTTVYIGCHESEPGTPCCWAAVRPVADDRWAILHTHARKSLRSDPELAAGLELALIGKIPHATVRVHLNPFLELRSA